MDPARKRKIRLVVALSAAVLLAAGLVYTSFSASTEAQASPRSCSPGRLGRDLRPHRQGGPGHDPAHRRRSSTFTISDRDGSRRRSRSPTPARCPDPFRDGREVIVTGKLEDGTFVAEHDSLITKCPSKFSDEAEADPEHVIIE